MGRRSQLVVLLVAVSAVVAGVAVGGGSAATRHALALVWSGTLEGNGTADGTASRGQICSGSWQGPVRFTVTGSTLDGTGSVDLGSQSCTQKLPTPFITHVDFTISGTRETSGPTRYTLLLHAQSIQGGEYDPTAFLIHFGQTNQGIPLVLTPAGNRIDQMLTSTQSVSNATVTLNDHFVLSSTCDENLLSLANDEFDLAQERETEGVKEMTESDQIVSKAFTSTVASLGAEQVVEKALIKGIEALASEGTATLYEIGGTVVTLQNIETKEIPELRNEYRESRNLRDQADKDFAFADKADKVARKDLDDALAQGPCIGSAEDELNKLEKEQALQQQIQKKVDSWRAAGSRDMYVVNGQLTDVAGATAAAKAALTGNGRSLQAVSTERLSVKASASQLKAALAGVKRALAACARVKTKLASYKQTTTATIARIRALLRS